MRDITAPAIPGSHSVNDLIQDHFCNPWIYVANEVEMN